ncbi:MAG: ligand-gated channel [Hirschia sp.]|nr:ligand-gated channel [Hirschia sp.]MBF19760.1 ligand-gated channel [Hirschia sp.]
MTNTIYGKAALKSASALLLALAVQPAAFAQDNTPSDDTEFLGTLTLGESKREVQTDTATALTIIDQEEADDRQAGTIAELIDSVPGVNLVNGSTPTGSGINIRGFGANGTYGTDQKVAILVDNASVGSEELYRIGTQLYTDPSLYKNVEVIRGTVGSFEYGSGIVGGVVKLETIDASDMTGGEPGFAFRQTLGASTNRDGFNSSSTLAIQPTENFELLGNFSWRQQTDQEDGSGNDIPNSAFELPSFLLKARYAAGDHRLTASYTNSETSDRDVPYDSFGTTSGAFGNVDRDVVSQTTSLAYNFNPVSDFIDLDAIVSYANQEIDQEYVEGSSPFAPPGGFAVVSADQQYETTKLTVKNTALLDTGPFSHELRTGVEVIEKERLEASSAPGGTDTRFALFVVDQIEFADGWTFSPALRFETSEIEGNGAYPQSYDNDALMGGASLRYEFQSGFALFGSYAHTESLPIIDDLSNPTYMEQPEIGDTFELGSSYSQHDLFAANDAFSLKVNVYQTDLDDVTSYSGVSKIELSGLEIESSYAMQSGLYVDLNANLVEGDELDGDGLESDWRNLPADSLRFTLGKRFSDLIDLSSEVLAADDRTLNGQTDTGYVTLNMRANLTPQDGILEGTSFRLGIENVLDHTYTPALATRTAPGRNVKLTVARTF